MAPTLAWGIIIQRDDRGAAMITTLLIASVIPFAVTLLAVGLMLRHAPTQMLDVPNARSSHSIPTPRGGGIGVLLGLLVGGAGWIAARHQPITVPLMTAFAAALAVAIISLLDDLRPLPSWLRLMVHLASAFLIVNALGVFEVVAIPMLGQWHPGGFALILSLFWCVGLTNAYNFLDGIDGIAGAQGLTAGLAWCGVGVVLGSEAVAGCGLALAAASLAFLRYNWSPAQIFLGDVGSATIGFSFAVLSLLAAHGTTARELIPAAGLLIVWPFLFDAIYTLIRRLGRREDVFAAHRGHLYQRLVMAGWPHARVATLYLILGVLDGAGAIALVANLPGAGPVSWCLLTTTAAALLVATQRAERSAPDRVSSGVTTAPGGRPSAR